MYWIIKIVEIGFLTVLLSIFASAMKSKSINISTQKDFSKGQFENTYLDDQRILSLTPGCRKLFEVEDEVIWKIKKIEGGILVGTGHVGNIYFVTDAGKRQKIETSAKEVSAMAQSPEGEIFFGTGPDATVYRLSGDKKRVDVFCVLPGTFVWDIAFDGARMLAATGDQGIIYEIDKKGNYREFFKSRDQNVVRIIFSKGFLYASTSDRGFLYRIASNGESELLFDAGGRDINDFEISGKTIYFATAGEKAEKLTPKQNKAPTSPIVVIQSPPAPTKNTPPANVQNKPKGYANDLYEFNLDDGSYRSLYTLYNQKIPTLKKLEGYIYFGTFEKGQIYRLDISSRSVEDLYQLEEGSASHFTKDDKRLYFASGTQSEVYEASLQYPEKGEYTSDVLDTGGVSQWGRIKYHLFSDNDKVLLWARVGNSKPPDEYWSQWEACEGSRILNRPARFIQFRTSLQVVNNVSPRISDIRIYYAQFNTMPQITFFDLVSRQNFIRKYQNRVKIEKDHLPFRWNFQDSDGDTLVFSLYYRQERNEEWSLLDENLERDYYLISKRVFPDGDYEFKLVASDSPRNTPEEALETYLFLNRMVKIDNTSPYIQDFKFLDKMVEFTVSDEISIIKRVLYSVDKKNFHILYPEDRIFDQQREIFSIALDEISSSEVFLQVEDADGNWMSKIYKRP